MIRFPFVRLAPRPAEAIATATAIAEIVLALVELAEERIKFGAIAAYPEPFATAVTFV